jgi:hypothetical protein
MRTVNADAATGVQAEEQRSHILIEGMRRSIRFRILNCRMKSSVRQRKKSLSCLSRLLFVAGITKRCTGVAAGGFSVFRASTGRNPVNAVVIPGRLTSSAFWQVDDSVMPRKSWLQFYRLCWLQMCHCPASSVRKPFYSLHNCCDRDHSLTLMIRAATLLFDTVNRIESNGYREVRSSARKSSDCCDDRWAS